MPVNIAVSAPLSIEYATSAIDNVTQSIPNLYIFLVVLIGGFIFTSNSVVLKYRFQKFSGVNAIYLIAASTLTFILFALLIRYGMMKIGFYEHVCKYWNEFSPIPFSGTAVLATVLGSVCWRPFDAILESKIDSSKQIHKHGNKLEIFLIESMMYDRNDENSPAVQITMRNRKVYIGWVVETVNHIQSDKYLALLPRWSGYRDPETLELQRTTDYELLYREILEDELADVEISSRELLVYISIDEIVSAAYFRNEIYERNSPLDIENIEFQIDLEESADHSTN